MERRQKNEAGKSDVLIRRRIEILLILFSLLVIMLIGRAGYWQIYKADWLKQMAQDQWSREIRIFADRGTITDRFGNPLAISTRCYTVVLQPEIINKQALNLNKESPNLYIDSLSNDLAQILQITPEDVKAFIAKEQTQVILKRNVTDTQADAIRSLLYTYTVVTDGITETKTKAYSGIIINHDIKREYPMESFLTQVLGFTSIDGIGLEGIESKFDKDLVGTNGKLVVETDREGVKISDGYELREDPIDGNNLQLTIDATLQSFAESSLDTLMYEQDPESATCIMMDPKTGAVLAMATKPDYDNNNPPRDNMETLRELTDNKAVSFTYEPGIAFSLITAAAALETGTASQNANFNCTGEIEIDEQKINCLSDEAHGSVNLTQAVIESCGITMAQVALSMGVNDFYDYIYGFGFGEKSGINLYGDSAGEVTLEKYVTDIELARISFGQAISVTPLQYVSALSAIANGGMRMQPYIVQSITSPDGEIIKEYTPAEKNKVISEYTADALMEILYKNVENGAARNCKINGYEIGGISGYSQKYDSEGEALQDKYIVSFAAIAPLNDPELVILIVVDEPKTGSNYGSKVAAPYAQDFLEEALPYLNILPDSALFDTGSTKEVPNILDMTLEEAQSRLAAEGFGCISEGFDGKIVSQIPGPGTMLKSGSNVIVQLRQVSDNGESYLVTVPDLFGLTPTEAMELLAEHNLTMRIVSSGNIVMEQNPGKGTEVYRGSQVAVEFEYFEKESEETE